MQLVEISKKKVIGLSARTTNAKEMDPSTGSIGRLWKDLEKISVEYSRDMHISRREN
jgi:predicted transcriptional regulator YdeE